MSSNPWEEFRSDVLECLAQAFEALEWPEEGLSDSLEEPPEPDFGDLASTICFELPEKLQESPQELAEKLADEIEPEGLVDRVEMKEGYVNFFVEMSKLSSLTLEEIEESGEEYGSTEKDGKESSHRTYKCKSN